jgi:hypothetical protein
MKSLLLASLGSITLGFVLSSGGLASADAGSEGGSTPTAEQIYKAARAPFRAMIEFYKLRQEFTERSDGTWLGVVRPSFEQQRETLATSHETFSAVVGPWDAVIKRLGSVHDASGRLSSIEEVFGVTDASRAKYLVVSSIDSTAQPGVHACVDVLIGVGVRQPEGFEKPELLPTRYGALTGCGLVKDVLVVAHPDLEENAQSIDEFEKLHFELDDAIAKVLGHTMVRTRVVLPPNPPAGPDSGDK